jgi:citrate lyase subunit beta/citryl-CoA lyase/(S)-citramalyl-CoA lyase
MCYARGRFCVACASYGIDAIDTASVGAGIAIDDMVAFEQECIEGRNEGFTAKAVIHPVQVSIVKRVFEISKDELEKHGETIRKYEESKLGFALNGTDVIAPPFVARARMMLSLYGQY